MHADASQQQSVLDQTTTAKAPPSSAFNAKVAASPVVSQSVTPSIVIQAPHEAVPVNIKAAPTDYMGIGLSIGASVIVAVTTSYIGFRIARHQLERQREDSRDQQRANTKAQLRLDAYKDFQVALTKYSDVESPFVRIALIRAELNSVVEAKIYGHELALSARFPQFNENFSRFQNSLCELCFWLERYECILPGFDIFKTALACAMYDLGRCRVAFDAVLHDLLPMDGFDHSGRPKVFNVKSVNKEAIERFDKAAAPLEIAINQALSWVSDLGVEAQNFTLADYADQMVNRRKAIDPTYFTVTANPADRQGLKAKFDATDYGRSVAASQSYAHRRYGEP